MTDKKQKDKNILKKIDSHLPWILFSIFAFAVICISYSFYFSHPIEPNGIPIEPSLRLERLAQKGDMFGAITSVFTGLAFAGLIATMWMQRKDLNLQRDAMDRQTEQLTAQKKQMELQAFESTFFQMLGVFSTYITSLDLPAKKKMNPKTGDIYYPPSIRGRDFLRDILEASAPRDSNITETSGDGSHRNVSPDVHLANYENLEFRTQTQLSTYFRILHNLLELIELTHFDADPRRNYFTQKRYTRIVRAQLTHDEIWLCVLNLATSNPNSFIDFKRRMKEYDMLKHAGKLHGLSPSGYIDLGQKT